MTDNKIIARVKEECKNETNILRVKMAALNGNVVAYWKDACKAQREKAKRYASSASSRRCCLELALTFRQHARKAVVK